MNALLFRDEQVSGTALKAVIIYDNLDFAGRVTALLERAATGADEGVKLDLKPWRLEVLKQPGMAAVTAAVAADADLIVLALAGTSSAPETLLDWLELWAAHRQIPDAGVLALRPDPDGVPTLSGDELERFADRRGLNLLNRFGGGNDEDDARARSWRTQKETESPRAPAHWGINE
jgi:hypothetical protein